jgi:predicted KAP-like P-loop ATPase
MCRVLFPPLDTIYANWSHGPETQQSWRRQKRICAKDIFDNYFLLGIPKGDISDEEMRTVMARADNWVSLKEALDGLFERNLGKRFLEIAEDYLGYIPLEVVEEAIVSFFAIEDRIVQQRRNMLDTGADLQTARLIYLLLQRLDNPVDRKRIITNAINRTTKIFLPVYLVALIGPDKDEVRAGETLRELGLSVDDLGELQTLCISKIRRCADIGELSKSPHLGMILFRWLAWGEESEVKDYVSRLVATDEGVLDLLVGLTSEVLSDAGRSVRIDKSNIAAFVEISLIETKVKDTIEPKMDQLSEKHREAVRAYLASTHHSSGLDP